MISAAKELPPVPNSASSCATRFFVARAFSPRIQVNARWIAVNALSRKAFAVAGKEPGSPLLAILADGGTLSDSETERAAATLGIRDQIAGSGFLNWFRVLNGGYPFLDYSRGKAQTLDGELMGAYAAEAPAPPLASAWDGPRLPLPEGRLELGSEPQPLVPDLISAWLRIAAGVTHVAPIRHSTAMFKTSPSGGARHPTDIGFAAGEGWPEEIRGGWWYDGVAHDLSRSAMPPLGPSADSHPLSIVFTVSSHVRRAMWRYRDPRAIRPVAIDAGHVVETLMTAIAASGWRCWWEPAAGFTRAGGDLDPIFGYVLAAPTGLCPRRAATPPLIRKAQPGEKLRTNPLISLVPLEEGVRAENHASPEAGIRVTPGMIDALAWATPSSRGDRPTAIGDLLDRYVSPEELDALIDQGLMIGVEEGDALWNSAKPWFEHDWYLSLLAVASETDAARVRVPDEAEPTAIGNRLPQALDGRRTTRSFSGDPIPPERAEEVIAALRRIPSSLEVVLTAFERFGELAPGTYKIAGDRLDPLPVALPSEDQVRAAAIGQPWVRNFSAIVWLLPMPGYRTGDWLGSFVDAGRAAQRLALGLCDSSGIGVFQSPALVDDILPSVLGEAAAIDGAYMIGLGAASPSASSGHPTEHQRNFRPSSLISNPAP